ncbi:MAG: chemotaxis-specific protein-glutamate methyltransferase CheB [Myxococcota bacterium]|nr:chemotaxis-specific protein-glutamate methyltransferase CheB [Myxococcota bacterium]
MIRVLIAEDSPAIQRVLISIFNEEKGIEIVGVVGNGKDAVELCRKTRPDLVTMDIYMPEMDGLEATRRIMEEHPTRVVIISSMVRSRDLRTFEAIRSGAVEIVEKPHGVLTGNYGQVRDALVKIIRQLMAAKPQNRFSWVSPKPWEAEGLDLPEISVTAATPSSAPPEPVDPPPCETVLPPDFESFIPRIISIGGSTGAPAVICDILSSLPGTFSIPIVIAQHIAVGFMKGMVDWLDSSVPLTVKLAQEGDIAKPGTIIVSPDNANLEIRSRGVIHLREGQETDLYTPSIDIFFQSVADAFGDTGMGIILSGMGRDGALGLQKMRQAGALTIAQNEESSVIYGMPKEATAAGAVLQEMDPKEMISLLNQIHDRA